MNTKANTSKRGTQKLNFFDVLIIIFVSIALMIGGVLLFIRARQSSNTVTLQYTVLVKDLITDINIHMEPGQQVIDTVRLNSLGTVVSYDIIPATYNAYDEDTKLSYIGTYENMNSVSVVIEATAVKADMTYEVNGVAVSVGTPIYFRTPTFTGRGYVTALTVDGQPIVENEEVTEEHSETQATDKTSEDTTSTEALTEPVTAEA